MYYNGQTVSRPSQQRQPPQQSQRYYVTHEFGGSAELTTTLIHALADVTGLDMTEAEATVEECVDRDALDRLFAPMSDGTPRTNSQLGFTAWGHRVTVYSNGRVSILPPGQHPPVRG
jgi:hypothetical protein